MQSKEKDCDLSATSGTKKILVVDDSLTIRMQVKELLEDNGFQVLLAENGEMCLKVLEKETPEVILLDIIMPEMDGIEVCRRIKTDDALKEIPILILTTVSDIENKVRGLNAGADDYVTKPFEVVELIARVNSILRTKGLLEQLKREIAERLRTEKEREKLIQELKNTLLKVKTLSGLLPICAACKKIRDDSGYWNQIEEYVRDHSDADFSHSICPECREILYPKIAKSRKGIDE
jgi:DNA-binding response OmpR family regulator